MKKNKLHKIAPKLSEITPVKTGFQIPENYFKTVEDSIMAELKADNFQNKITNNTFKTPDNYFNSVEDLVITKLKAVAIQEKNDTIIPDNYFDSIEDKVLSKLKTTSKVISFKSRITKFVAPFAIAASLLLIFILNNNSDTITFDSLTSSEIENWIDNGNIDIDALNMASIYPEIELTNEVYSTSLSDEEVLEYLYGEDLEEIIYEN